MNVNFCGYSSLEQSLLIIARTTQNMVRFFFLGGGDAIHLWDVIRKFLDWLQDGTAAVSAELIHWVKEQ